MTLGAYLRDRLPKYGIHFAGWLLTLVFLFAFRVRGQAIAALTVLGLLALATAELWDFARRKRYYDSLQRSLCELDQTYLIAETLPEAEFLEARLLSEALRKAGKSMTEHVRDHRQEAADFREYIELWVHEVKLPLAGLMLMCHNERLDHRYTEQLQRVDDCVENVLFYARSENPEKDFVFQEISLRRAFSAVVLRNRAALQERGIQMIAENLEYTVLTDGKWLEFIIGQVLANSLKYCSKERSPVFTVSAKVLTDRTELCIRDNGIGIPAADLPYVFEKCFTGQNGRTGAKATGMGLYIVKRLCDKLGHGIRVASAVDEGTSVTLSFGRNHFYQL